LSRNITKKKKKKLWPWQKKIDQQTMTILVSNPVAEKEKEGKMTEIVGSRYDSCQSLVDHLREESEDMHKYMLEFLEEWWKHE
jgi:hypothetical protein